MKQVGNFFSVSSRTIFAVNRNKPEQLEKTGSEQLSKQLTSAWAEAEFWLIAWLKTF